MLYLELGVGANTPAIIKYPFWKMTAQNPKAMYAYVNYGEAISPGEIEGQSICINKDISSVLNGLACEQNKKTVKKGYGATHFLSYTVPVFYYLPNTHRWVTPKASRMK